MVTTPKKTSPEAAKKKKKPSAAQKAETKASVKTTPKTSKAAKPKTTAKKKTSSAPKYAKADDVKATKEAPKQTTQSEGQSGNSARPASGGDAIAEKLWRLVGMVAFAMIANFTLYVLLILAAMQYVVSFISDKPNEEIRTFTGRLIRYFSEIFSYMSFQSNDMPFPFKEFPADK